MKLRDKTIDECITIIDRELPPMINECVEYFIHSPYTDDINTWEDLVGQSENDADQQTQAATKIIQSSINNCIRAIIKKFNLPIDVKTVGKGMDYRYVGNNQDKPLEVKCSGGGKDGKYASVPCIGNLKVLDSKSDLTLIFRYSVKVNKLVEWQTVTIDDSARKWVEYNDKKGKSNFSSLKCKGYDLEGNLVDFNDIKCYSGKIKPNKSSIDKNGKFRQGWVGFKREVLSYA